VLGLLALAAPAVAQQVRPDLWVTDGLVDAMARAGNTLYVGGQFDAVGPASGSGIPVNTTTGEALLPYARVVGTVNAVAADGAGGWFIGGRFSWVGGEPRSNLAHLAANGSVLPWNPGADSMVTVIAVSGGTVYVGGWFETLGAAARNKIGALDATTGAVLPFDAQIPVRHPFPPRVIAIAPSGATLYVSGFFSSIGGQPRTNLAGLDAATGAATTWNPGVLGVVLSMVVDGPLVYVGGGFSSIGGQPRTNLAALDAATGLATSWNPTFGPTWQNVSTLAHSGGKLLVGGPFLASGGAPHDYLAAFDIATGAPDASWNAQANGAVNSIVPLGERILVAGQFTAVGGAPRRYVAAVDTTTGAATAWDPNPSNPALALAAQGGSAYVGGLIATIGHQWVTRRNLAAIDLVTGAATAWDPAANDRVMTLALDATATTLYCGGYFGSVGGQPRAYAAALDPVTGGATSWSPAPNDLVSSLSVSGGTVYLGGYFTQVGGAPRKYAGAVDAASGLATAFDPNSANQISNVLAAGSRVYLAGIFIWMDGQVRNGLAAVDAFTGALDPWTPMSPTDYYSSPYYLALSGSTLLVAGRLDSLGGQARRNLGAVDVATGLATPFDPEPDGLVDALAVNDATLYVGGGFGRLAGQPRSGLASFQLSGGALTAWDPGPNGEVLAILPAGGTVFVGGQFLGMGALPQFSLAAVSDPVAAAPPPARTESMLAQNAPNPARESTTLSFSLPAAERVTLVVFDLQGRRVATPLDRVMRTAGPHELRLSTAGWRPGLYLCRLEAGARAETRKLLVAR
jgi:hypothetical protein